MKKITAILIAAVLIISVFTACAGANDKQEENKTKIVTTIFPIYDWVREIVGENNNVEVTMLLDSGVDLHSFQPSVDDVVKVSSCDMFIYVGG
ncbi:MAG: zinc ABC transporter substrate-binding protein, partial [Ruminococcus sp.]|nr:zinc ABC transporter substrate-binding protein [Ruminococcus sp.]